MHPLIKARFGLSIVVLFLVILVLMPNCVPIEKTMIMPTYTKPTYQEADIYECDRYFTSAVENNYAPAYVIPYAKCMNILTLKLSKNKDACDSKIDFINKQAEEVNAE